MRRETPLWLHIETLSDWAIGTGKGRYGSLDSMVARDADGLPFIPASTLKGMLRDASEQAALALDDGKGGDWCAFVDRLFGSQPVVDALGTNRDYERPTGGVLRFGAALLGIGPDGQASLLRQHLAGQGQGARRLRQALTLVKSGVAIDRMSGTASTDMLRFDEVSRQGLPLLARIDLMMSGPDAESVIAFLQAACFLMDRIGSKRRRGLGHIQTMLLTQSFTSRRPEIAEVRKDAARVLSQVGNAPQIALQSDDTLSPLSSTGQEKTLRATYTLLTPVLAATSVEGNVVLSADHLPGSMLLPAVKKACAAKSGRSLDAAINAGDFRVAPAWPVEKGVVGVPAPACFERLKSKPTNAADDRLFNMMDEEDKASSVPAQKKGLGGGYLRIEAEEAISFRVSRSLFTHNSILDETQRPDSSIGGVYVYEALSAGTQFVGSVSVSEDVANAVHGGTFDLSIGRAKTAGYGRVRVTLEHAEPVKVTVSDLVVRLFLNSDAICHGAYGQPEASADALGRAIAEASGLEPDKVRIEKSVLKARAIESWSVSAGLPRPSLIAIAAGSVAYVRFESVAEAQIFADRAARGIGERIAEGFGQLLLNPSWLANNANLVMRDGADNAPSSSLALPPLKSKEPDYATAELIERTAWQTYLVDAVEALVADPAAFRNMFGFTPGASDDNGPSASQLGGLKAVIVAAGDTDVSQAIRRFLSRPEPSVPNNAAGPSTEMGKKLGTSCARAIWNIASRPVETVFPALHAKLPEQPTCLISLNARDAFLKNADFAISALILAGIQMHGRKRPKAGQVEEVA